MKQKNQAVEGGEMKKEQRIPYKQLDEVCCDCCDFNKSGIVRCFHCGVKYLMTRSKKILIKKGYKK